MLPPVRDAMMIKNDSHRSAGNLICGVPFVFTYKRKVTGWGEDLPRGRNYPGAEHLTREGTRESNKTPVFKGLLVGDIPF